MRKNPDIPVFKMPNVDPTWRFCVRSVVCPYTQHVLSYYIAYSLHITYPTYCPKNLNKGIIIISLYPTFCMVAPGFLNAHWSYGGRITYCKPMQWLEIDCDMVKWYHSLSDSSSGMVEIISADVNLQFLHRFRAENTVSCPSTNGESIPCSLCWRASIISYQSPILLAECPLRSYSGQLHDNFFGIIIELQFSQK